ncbi:translation initiation factor IF-2-like [Pipra filicauda]|uniref:Translation initiation factor IF-2-like n=1 Tax=Pipra filicauda TaxID=649802 RepID=A0A7R5KRH7_9PASS|nr:translation initiation factor IF-2-like [Pipra filicauda]
MGRKYKLTDNQIKSCALAINGVKAIRVCLPRGAPLEHATAPTSAVKGEPSLRGGHCPALGPLRPGVRAGPSACPTLGAACAAAAPWQRLQGRRRRPPRLPPPAPPRPERSRGRSPAARAAPHWLPPQEPAGAARPHCPSRSQRIPPSLPQRTTASGPKDPARRRASTPPRPAARLGPHLLRTAPPPAPIPGSCTAPGRRRQRRSHGGLCLPAVRGARPARPSPGSPRPEVALRPAGSSYAAPCRGRLPWPRRGLGGRRSSRRLRAACAAGSLALPLEQWGPGRAGRGAGRTGVGASLLRRRRLLLSAADRRHHAAAPRSLPLPRSDGNPGRDVSPAPWDRPAAGGGASAGGGGPHRGASHSAAEVGPGRALGELAGLGGSARPPSCRPSLTASQPGAGKGLPWRCAGAGRGPRGAMARAPPGAVPRCAAREVVWGLSV